MPKPTPDEIAQIVKDNQRGIRYDTKDWSIEMVLRKYNHIVEDAKTREISIPFYQRNFVWSDEQISLLIETILLGLPLPLIFLEETENGLFEIIDGSQRIRALNAFFLENKKLKGLKILAQLNQLRYQDLPPAIQRQLNNTSLRIIVMQYTDDFEKDISNEIFKRINTAGTMATKMEITKGANYGGFIKLVYELSEYPKFKEISKFGQRYLLRGYQQEFVMKFFGYYALYKERSRIEFTSSIDDFLDTFSKQENIKCKNTADINILENRFNDTLDFIIKNETIQINKYTTRKKEKLLAIMLAVALYLDEPNAKQDNKVDIWQQEFETNANSPSIDSLNKNINFVLNKLNNG